MVIFLGTPFNVDKFFECISLIFAKNISIFVWSEKDIAGKANGPADSKIKIR
jgi:hypothetical protein